MGRQAGLRPWCPSAAHNGEAKRVWLQIMRLASSRVSCPMYRTKGEDGNSSTESSSYSSDDDRCSVESLGDQVPPPSPAEDDSTSSAPSRQNTPGAPLRRMSSVAFLCAVAVALGVGSCRSCFRGFYWTDVGRSSGQAELKADPPLAAQQLLKQDEDKVRSSWCLPVRDFAHTTDPSRLWSRRDGKP